MRDPVQVSSRTAPWMLAAALALPCAQEVLAQQDRVIIPPDTVIRAQLSQPVNSRTAQRGDRVTAVLAENDRSEFPMGTRFEGTVTEVRRASEDRPAILDMDFRRAVLPGGQAVAVRGELASLSEDTVRRRDGRLESRRDDGNGFDWKWVGYGAAGGAVLGEIFGDDFLKGALLGGLGGAIYGYLNRDRDRGEFREVELPRGTEFGIRLDRQVAFNPGPNYVAARERDERVLGSRQELRGAQPRLLIDGRAVNFGDTQPVRINGTNYVPLRQVAREAGWTLDHQAGTDDFTLTTPFGDARAMVGDRTVRQGNNTMTLSEAPVLIGDEVYVPVEFLGRVDNRRIRWDRRGTMTSSPTPQGAQNGDLGRVDFTALTRGLAGMDYPDFQQNARGYRIVDLKRTYNQDDVAPLFRMVDQNSGARRNQLLFSNFMRESRLIGDARVVGADPERMIIYIY